MATHWSFMFHVESVFHLCIFLLFYITQYSCDEYWGCYAYVISYFPRVFWITAFIHFRKRYDRLRQPHQWSVRGGTRCRRQGATGWVLDASCNHWPTRKASKGRHHNQPSGRKETSFTLIFTCWFWLEQKERILNSIRCWMHNGLASSCFSELETGLSKGIILF